MKPLIIQAPTTGVGTSPYTGYGNVRGIDISSVPGVAKLNNKLTKRSSTTVTALPLWIKSAPDNAAIVFALDGGGQLYKSTDTGATWAVVTGETAGGSGQGMEIIGGYVIVARAAFLDVYSIAGNSWTNGWQAIDSDTAWHPMLRSKNDWKIYGGAGRYVYSIEELTTFSPTDVASYTFTARALDLPPNYRIKCLAELGNNLEIGTWMGTNVYDLKVADLFPWDRSSTSFGQPVQFNDNGIHSMANIGNQLVLQVGIGGDVYSSDGVGKSLIGSIPQSIADLAGGKYIEAYPGAIVNHKGRALFGVSNGGSGTFSGMGIWSIHQTNLGNALVMENVISSGNDGSSVALKVGALCSISRDAYIAGWRDTTYGIDKIDNAAYPSDSTAYFDTPMYTVGTTLEPAQFTQLDVETVNPIYPNESLVIKWRESTDNAYTTFATINDTNNLGEKAHNFVADIPALTTVQLRVIMIGTTTTPSFRTITLR